MSSALRYLLDTNVMSETRKKLANERVMAFLAGTDPSALYMSVLAVGELRKGVTLKRKSDAEAARQLASWVDGLEYGFGERFLPIDSATARLWGELSADCSRPVVDMLLAATAITHDLIYVTRNTRDVEGIDVKLLNPWIVT
ncbi:MAG TPA: type II toxin-antitoxin system VapC family toxin [Acidisarcina sp.]